MVMKSVKLEDLFYQTAKGRKDPVNKDPAT